MNSRLILNLGALPTLGLWDSRHINSFVLRYQQLFALVMVFWVLNEMVVSGQIVHEVCSDLQRCNDEMQQSLHTYWISLVMVVVVFC